jgi:YegS/Rv2252/BmrU family lipid kinase
MDAITVVANAAAGTADGNALDRVVELFGERAETQVIRAADESRVESLLAEVSGSVVVAGGDGSLHLVVQALHRHDRLGRVLIGLIPMGTGNDFARSVGLPIDDPSAAARVFLDGERRAVDLAVDETGGVVVNAVHLGVGAEAGRRAEPWKARLGKPGYAIGAVLAGARTRGHRVRVVADGRVLADGRRLVLQAAVGNGSMVGGGTPLLPDADPHDGELDVMVSFAVGTLSRLRYALRLRRGTHDDSREVVTALAKKVEISGSAVWLNADGELAGPGSRRSGAIAPGAFTMVLPAARTPAGE